MPTILATAGAGGTAAESASAIVKQLNEKLAGTSPALVLAFASTKQPLESVAAALCEAYPDATVLGASTAGEFTEKGATKSMTTAVALAGDFIVEAGMGTNLKEDLIGATQSATERLTSNIDGYPHRTGIMLLDPLSGNGEEATLVVAGTLEQDVPLAGGAAGDDLKMTETHVSLGRQCASDAIVTAVIHSKKPFGVGVCHGHEPLSSPVTVTKATGGTVFEVDERPAWDVWAERTKESAAKRNIDPEKLSGDDVGAFLLQYEAGLATGTGDNYKIRAPLSKNEDGSLNFACGIPEGAAIRITESQPQRQIDSAIAAAKQARERMGDAAAAGAIVFDCICRNLILNEQFDAAVQGISKELGDVPLAGFETYGEIAMSAGDMSGFHNTTTVVLAVPA